MAQKMKLPAWFAEERDLPPHVRGGRVKRGFIDKNLDAVTGFMKEVFESHEYSRRKGLLQAVETRARTGGIMLLVFSGAFMERTFSLLFLVLLAVAIMRLSGVDSRSLFKRVLPSVVFTGILVVPAFFSFITPGTDLFSLSLLGLHTSVTVEGVEVGLRLLVRVSAMVSLVALLFLTTREADLFKGLKGIAVPVFFITALFMTFRYILVLLRTVEDSSFAKKSRTISRTALKESQGWFAGRVAFLLERTVKISEEVTRAMASRGFTGEIKTLGDRALGGRDYLWLGFTSFVFFLALGL